MTTFQVPSYLPKAVAQKAASKAKREKRRIVICRKDGEIKFMTVPQWTRNLRKVERIGQITPMGIFSD